MATTQEILTRLALNGKNPTLIPQAPPTALGNNAAVTAAYQKLMSYNAQSDAVKGQMQRNLTTNLETSHTNRDKSLLNSRENASDRGILNSGAALVKAADLNQQYDTTDSQMNNNYLDSLSGIDRNLNDYMQQYQDAQVNASQQATQAQAEAASQALQAQRDAADQKAQQDSLIAALQGAIQPTPQTLPINPYIAPAKTIIAKKTTVPTKITQPKLVLHGGPQ